MHFSKQHRLYNGIWERMQATWKSKYCSLGFVLSKAYEEKTFQMLIPSISKSCALCESYLGVLLAPLKAIAKLPLASKQTEYYSECSSRGWISWSPGVLDQEYNPKGLKKGPSLQPGRQKPYYSFSAGSYWRCILRIWFWFRGPSISKFCARNIRTVLLCFGRWRFVFIHTFICLCVVLIFTKHSEGISPCFVDLRVLRSPRIISSICETLPHTGVRTHTHISSKSWRPAVDFTVSSLLCTF